MRINNSKHVPWIIFVFLATIGACILYVGNFHPALLPSWIHLPASLIQKSTEHHTVGGTPLGLWFGSISLAIFIFAALLSLRKKIPLWRVGTVQRWLRAHIWLTILTIPLVILHSGFRFGGGMTTFLMVLYGIVMVSGFYGLFLQHIMPRLMKERLPAETVFEQIPHIRSQLAAAAEKMRDSFKPAQPKKPNAAAPAPSASKAVAVPAAVMASTKGELSTPVARAKSATGSAEIAAPVAAAATAASATPSEPPPAMPSIPNAAVRPATPKVETIGTPTARVQSDPPGAPVARSEVPAGDQSAPSPPVAPPAPEKTAAVSPPAPAAKAATPKTAAPAAAKPPAAAPKPAAKTAAPADPASEAVLIEFIERQILPYLQARRGDRMRLNNPRFSDDTFRFVKLRVTEGYRSRVEEIQGWCDERRMLDVQVRLHHWLHGWLFVHVPFSFLLLMLTIWHACVTLFYY
ncbi:MAG: hypothetical protein QOE26_428 [Verrucomicrobiota bacterium]|jgi:hypothetical protein